MVKSPCTERQTMKKLWEDEITFHAFSTCTVPTGLPGLPGVL